MKPLSQITDTILMVRPANFGFNSETAQNNVFQKNSDLSKDEISSVARAEFDQMVAVLRDHGVKVMAIEDTASPLKTDAVFPNNWFSTHANGKVVLYPMYSPNRRLERRDDIIDQLRLSYKVELNDQLLQSEAEEIYLEGTGSMIFDRQHKIAYACYSQRTNPQLLAEAGEILGYQVVGFNATDRDGLPYYHTNVIMHVGEHLAILCTESIENKNQRQNVIDILRDTQKEIIEISRDQVAQFAGNMLEVRGASPKNLLIMSQSARDCLTEKQLHIIKIYNLIVSLPVSTIEHHGGGSVRCMMAEIFLPAKS